MFAWLAAEQLLPRLNLHHSDHGLSRQGQLDSAECTQLDIKVEAQRLWIHLATGVIQW